MKFKMKVMKVSTGDAWWEEYSERTDDAQKYAESMINRFNETLRPHESPRQLLEVVKLSDVNEKHAWYKLTSGQSVIFRGHVVDIMECSCCHITGKRFGLNSFIKIDSKYKKKAFQKCNTAMKELGLD